METDGSLEERWFACEASHRCSQHVSAKKSNPAFKGDKLKIFFYQTIQKPFQAFGFIFFIEFLR